MAKKKTTKKKTKTTKKTSKKKSSARVADASGKQLVIVESPAKAKTINRYLGPDFVVAASVGHVRDLPSKSPKGEKQPVPGVDLENRFEPTYEVLSGKKKVVTELKRNAKKASQIWFATDLDREGEAIAWHLAQELGIEPGDAKRVVFNAITKVEIERAFQEPHPIDEFKVNAQQARRILDRIVGYQASPLLWKKVARGLSAGRVQSVAVRIVVDREREIDAFVPDEIWKVAARLTPNVSQAPGLVDEWSTFINTLDERKKPPTLRLQNRWLAEHGAFKTELVELGGKKFSLTTKADEARDLSKDVLSVADAVGLVNTNVDSEENPDGKGPAKTIRRLSGAVDPDVRYRVCDVERKQTRSRPTAPFITSSLQMAASTALSFNASRTMRVAQMLYEGTVVKGEGQVGLITYMRTDSTHLSGDAINMARNHILKTYGDTYLPDKPNIYKSSNKSAQEAHEAIRPTDAARTPDSIRGMIDDDQHRLYELIWKRFVACQMTPAVWDATNIRLERDDRKTGAVLRCSGRVLAFDGFYRVAGVPTSSDEQTLPSLEEGTVAAPFDIVTEQTFTSPPPRYSEASLVKTMEAEGIGRPSTYAAIIKTVQDRNYVELRERRFYATDLGEVVTDKMIEGFPRLMDVGYTRQMEEELDRIEDAHTDWKVMLEAFYGRFSKALESAQENMTHAKAERQAAPYKCPECGSTTCYRFGKNGRFLSCEAYPDCNYAAPINRKGEPLLPERVNVRCPEDGSAMEMRNGRFGPFLASVAYPETKFVINLDKKGMIKYPAIPPIETDLECPTCSASLNLREGKRGPWLGCSTFPKCRGRMAWTKLEDDVKQNWTDQLEAHKKANPQIKLETLDGQPIPEGTPVGDLLIEGGVQKLELHPDAGKEIAAATA